MSLHDRLMIKINNPIKSTYDIPVSGFNICFKFSDLTEYEYNTCKCDDAIETNVNVMLASCVHPDLDDVELQESYGVDNPCDLLYKLIPNAKEFSKVLSEVQKQIKVINSYNEVADVIFEELKKSRSDAEVVIRSYALTECHVLPSEFDKLGTLDKAYIAASSMYKAYTLDQLKRK